MPLDRMRIPLGEIDSLLGTSLVRELQLLLSDTVHPAGSSTKAQAVLTRLQSLDLSHTPLLEVVEGLNGLQALLHLEPQVSKSSSSAPAETAVSHLSQLTSRFQQYVLDGRSNLSAKIGLGDRFERLASRSPHDPVHQELTKLLRREGLISPRDVVIVSGGSRNWGERSFQICIVNLDQVGADQAPSRSSAWFLWNSSGSGRYSVLGGVKQLDCSFELPLRDRDVKPFHNDASSFLRRIDILLRAGYDENSAFSHHVRQSFPLCPVSPQTSMALRLIPYISAGYGRESFLSPASYPTHDEVLYTIPTLVEQLSVTKDDYSPRGGANRDMMQFFEEALTLQEIHARQQTVAGLRHREESCRSFIRSYFTGQVGSYRNPRNEWNVLKWYFLDWDSSNRGTHGYTTYIRYPARRMIEAVRRLGSFLKRNAGEMPGLVELDKAFSQYIASPAMRELADLVQRRQLSDPDHVRQGGRREGDLLNSIAQITARYPSEVYGLMEAVRRFEYLVVLASISRYYPRISSTPRFSPATSAISFKEIRNPGLVVAVPNPEEQVRPNTLEFSEDAWTILLHGSNGGGKTQLLEAVITNIVLAHRGADVFAGQMTLPQIASVEIFVNESEHSDEGSAFESEIRALVSQLDRLQQRLPDLVSVWALDEFGRGTNKHEAFALLVAVMVELEQQNVRLVCSTHYNERRVLDAVIERYGLHVKVYTMKRGGYQLSTESGRSYALEEAIARGIPNAIIQKARMLEAADNSVNLFVLRRGQSVERSPFEFTVPSDNVLKELGLVRVVNDVEWGMHRQLGAALRHLCPYSPLGKRPSRDQLRPDVADTLCKLLFQELSPHEREDRHALLNYLATVSKETCPADDLSGLLEKFEDFRQIFSFYLRVRKSDDTAGELDWISSLFAIGLSGATLAQDENIAFAQFRSKLSSSDPRHLLQHLARLETAVSEYSHPAFARQCVVLTDFIQGPGYTDLSNFLEQNSDLLDQTRITQSLWRSWVRQCQHYQEDLALLHQTIMELSGFATIARAALHEGWSSVTNLDEPGSISFLNLRNTSLLGKVPEVVPVSFHADAGQPVTVITGTNRGGKTQAVTTIARSVVLAKLIGFVSAESASIGYISTVDGFVRSSLHSAEKSSFQDALDRVRALIERSEKDGNRSHAFYFMDEPYKGTSEEEAINPLAATLDELCQDGSHVIFPTHYSGLLDVLDAQPLARPYRALYVDYFDPDNRFRLREGRGTSSGIRVAQDIGMPQRIVDRAYEVAELLRAGV